MVLYHTLGLLDNRYFYCSSYSIFDKFKKNAHYCNQRRFLPFWDYDNFISPKIINFAISAF